VNERTPLLTISKCRDLDYYEREVIEGREEYLSALAAAPPADGSEVSPQPTDSAA